MTLTVNLSPDLEQALKQVANREGVPPDEYVIRMLKKELSTEEKRVKLIAALRSWMEEGDEEEQRETGEYLIRVLDEDRLSDRPLYPPELKGITW